MAATLRVFDADRPAPPPPPPRDSGSPDDRPEVYWSKSPDPIMGDSRLTWFERCVGSVLWGGVPGAARSIQLTNRQIAAKLGGCDPTAVSKALARLAEFGYIRIDLDPKIGAGRRIVPLIRLKGPAEPGGVVPPANPPVVPPANPLRSGRQGGAGPGANPRVGAPGNPLRLGPEAEDPRRDGGPSGPAVAPPAGPGPVQARRDKAPALANGAGERYRPPEVPEGDTPATPEAIAELRAKVAASLAARRNPAESTAPVAPAEGRRPGAKKPAAGGPAKDARPPIGVRSEGECQPPDAGISYHRPIRPSRAEHPMKHNAHNLPSYENITERGTGPGSNPGPGGEI